MKNKIFERDYSRKCEGLDDIVFFGEFARANSLFDSADEQQMIEFSRFASSCVCLAAESCALLAAYRNESSVSFDISSKKFVLSQEAFCSLDGISKTSNVALEYSEEKIHLVF